MKIKRMQYTKDNGEVSNRLVVVVAEPKDNYLCYDISNFKDDEIRMLEHFLEAIEEYRNDTLLEFEDVTGIKINTLWRSFKPTGIEWDHKDDFI